ncbi:hypothetical protein HDV05_001673 [Chytridiales sp. JEL 0842]|nr:hypothetical protein HDV05_001673 [Chytridiales sp. JEL 0842]
MTELQHVSFLAKSSMAFQVWKETQPDLFWFFEKNFGAIFVNIKLTAEERTYIIEMEMPAGNVTKLEKAFKDGSLIVELDKIHGIDPAISHGKRDVKVSRLTVTMGATRPQNTNTQRTIENLEEQLIKLELLERTRSIDLKAVMDSLQSFQLDFQKKFEGLEKRVDETTVKLDKKCEKLEKAMARFRK